MFRSVRFTPWLAALHEPWSNPRVTSYRPRHPLQGTEKKTLLWKFNKTKASPEPPRGGGYRYQLLQAAFGTPMKSSARIQIGLHFMPRHPLQGTQKKTLLWKFNKTKASPEPPRG